MTMKKYIFSFITVIIAFSAHAQEVGGMWVGGSSSGQYTKPSKGDADKIVKINPEFGISLSDKIGIGINIGFEYAKNLLSGESYSTDRELFSMFHKKNRGKSFTASPFIRYTFFKGKLGSLFIDGGLFYTHSRTDIAMASFTAKLSYADPYLWPFPKKY